MARKKSESKGSLELTAPFERSIKFKHREFKFTAKQQRFLKTALDPETKIIFVSGPAGSSKTYMGVYALLQLMQQDFNKDLIYIRSIAESADKGLGSLPGDIAEKFDPFLMPLYDKMEEILYEGDMIYLKNKEKLSDLSAQKDEETTKDLSEKIQINVKENFSISLEAEVNII